MWFRYRQLGPKGAMAIMALVLASLMLHAFEEKLVRLIIAVWGMAVAVALGHAIVRFRDRRSKRPPSD